MELLDRRAEGAINKLIRFARGDKALVNDALTKYNTGQINDLVGYVEKHRAPKRPEAISQTTAPSDFKK